MQQPAVLGSPLAHSVRTLTPRDVAKLAVNQNPEAARPRPRPEQELRAVRRAAQAQGGERQARRHWHEGDEDDQGLQQPLDQAVAFAADLGLRTLIILR